MAAIAALPDRSRILLVTDDTEPALLGAGHLSLIVRKACEAGMPPHEAVAAATIRAARYLGVRHQRPFLMLSLLALSVSPRFKLSDKGVVDTERRRLLPTWERGHTT